MGKKFLGDIVKSDTGYVLCCEPEEIPHNHLLLDAFANHARLSAISTLTQNWQVNVMLRGNEIKKGLTQDQLARKLNMTSQNLRKL